MYFSQPGPFPSLYKVLHRLVTFESLMRLAPPRVITDFTTRILLPEVLIKL